VLIEEYIFPRKTSSKNKYETITKEKEKKEFTQKSEK
jgi:hypothetical protein